MISCHLIVQYKMGKMVNFMLSVLYHNKKLITKVKYKFL